MDVYDEMLPKPWLAIEQALKTFGGWSRCFRTSLETYEQKHIILKMRDPGFWPTFTRVKVEEQLREEVDEMYSEYRMLYPEDRRNRNTIKRDITSELLNSNWKPKKGIIKTEMRLLISKIEEDVSCLRPRKQQRK